MYSGTMILTFGIIMRNVNLYCINLMAVVVVRKTSTVLLFLLSFCMQDHAFDKLKNSLVLISRAKLAKHP
jgi:hypothetical protein